MIEHSGFGRVLLVVLVLIAALGGLAIQAKAQQAAPKADDFSWRVSAPTIFPSSPASRIPITIEVGKDQTTSNLSVEGQQIFEKSTGVQARSFKLCRDNACDPAAIGALAAGSNHLDLVPDNAINPCPDWPSWICPLVYGDFQGKVIIVSDKKPIGEEITLDLPTTDWWIKLIGSMILVIGLIVSTTFIAPMGPNPIPPSNPAAPKRDGIIARASRRGLLNAKSLFYDFPRSARSTAEPDFRPVLLEPVTKLLQSKWDVGDRDKQEQDVDQGIRMISTALKAPSAQMSQREEIGSEYNILHKSQARVLLVVSSAAAGISTIVLTTSFGNWKDLVACLLWGLGSPIGSKAIASLIALASSGRS